MTSWRCLPEYRGLADELAKARMNDFKGEAKFAPAEVGMRDHQVARGEECRQPQPATAGLQKVARAAEQQGRSIDEDPQRHADAESNIFLQTCGSGEALRRMNDLGKPVAPRTDAGPDLATRRRVLGHGDDDRNLCL